MPDSPGTIVLQLEPSTGIFRSSEGAFATLRNGRILLYYSQFNGGYKDNAAAQIVSRYSDDGGQTWSVRDELIIPNQGQCNVMSVSLLRLADGRLTLLYLVKNGPEDCRPRLLFSSDDGANWSPGVDPISEPGYYIVNNDRLVQLRSGRLIIPTAIHIAPSEPAAAKCDSATFFLSDDAGHTWRRCNSTLRIDDPQTQVGIEEPGLVELPDGRLFAWCRTDLGCQYVMESLDQGQSWSNPQPSNLVSPKSPLSLKTIPAGTDLLAIWNDHSGRFPLDAQRGRQPLVSAISSDAGKTWTRHQQLETDLSRGYHYTAIHFTGEHVLLAYCAGPKGPGKQLNTLRVRRLPRAWFYAS